MKKHLKLSSLAALGLLAGTMGSAEAATPSMCVPLTSDQVAELFSKLDAQHQAKFNSMSCEDQAIALKMVNQTCAGKNDCKGLAACKSDKNDCAGKNSCKGTATKPFADKNKAIDTAEKTMAAKRMNSMSR